MICPPGFAIGRITQDHRASSRSALFHCDWRRYDATFRSEHRHSLPTIPPHGHPAIDPPSNRISSMSEALPPRIEAKHAAERLARLDEAIAKFATTRRYTN